MATAGGWRQQLFESGVKYRVLKDWTFFGSAFTSGTIVEFESAGYERYDNTSLFRFVALDGPRDILVWRLLDDEPESKVLEYFQRTT